MFGADDQERLLAIARRSLDARVRGLGEPLLDSGTPLDARRGAFVSIHRGRQLRGCLGRLDSNWAICRVIARLAQQLSDSDPRFDPVRIDELTQLHIEISILTPGCEVRAVGDIEIGRHGLIVEKGFHRGLLLPQVATQYGWDAAAFLEHTSLKAGLGRDEWRDGRVMSFEAQVFAEPGRDLKTPFSPEG
jgi:AmmeMemoRadiSam system protein A